MLLTGSNKFRFVFAIAPTIPRKKYTHTHTPMRRSLPLCATIRAPSNHPFLLPTLLFAVSSTISLPPSPASYPSRPFLLHPPGRRQCIHSLPFALGDRVCFAKDRDGSVCGTRGNLASGSCCVCERGLRGHGECWRSDTLVNLRHYSHANYCLA
jgi:hypothetical protein